MTWREKATLAAATGFGLGLSPVASGTFGALWGLPLAWGLTVYCPVWLQAAAALSLAALAVPICDFAENRFGRKDDRRIVADEYLTFPLAVIGLPLAQAPLMLAAAFVVSRACDVVKPWPARGLQSVRGGLGVVIDDVVASLYALAVNWALFLWVYPTAHDAWTKFWNGL